MQYSHDLDAIDDAIVLLCLPKGLKIGVGRVDLTVLYD